MGWKCGADFKVHIKHDKGGQFDYELPALCILGFYLGLFLAFFNFLHLQGADL